MSSLKERQGLTGLGRIKRGTHVRFGDKLDVDSPVLRLLDHIMFEVIDTVVYGPKDVVMLDTKGQLLATKEVPSVWNEVTGSPDAVDKVQNVKTKEVIEYSWQGDADGLRDAAPGRQRSKGRSHLPRRPLSKPELDQDQCRFN